MPRLLNVLTVFIVVMASSTYAFAAKRTTLRLSLRSAEWKALHASNLIKAYAADTHAADKHADAMLDQLLPALSFDGSYQYFNEIPKIALGPGPAIPFGTNSTYSFGPQLRYTLWDFFSKNKAYEASKLASRAGGQNRSNARLSVLLALRQTYVQVELGSEELRLIHNSLALARAQDHDVKARYRAGAASRLDLITADRSVLSFEIQFKQSQAQLSSSLKDLLALLGDHYSRDLSRPGPAGMPGLTLALKLEPLTELLRRSKHSYFPPPNDAQPQIKSLLLQARSFNMAAKSQSAKLWPAIELTAGVIRNRPNMPNPPVYWQETVGLSLHFPLFLGDSARNFAAEKRSQALAASYRADQLRIDLKRDYSKGRQMLSSLKEQLKLSLQDVAQSEKEAKLYYISYKAGKINFIDVQSANNQALQAKVSAARIDAQILDQIAALEAISGKRSRL